MTVVLTGSNSYTMQQKLATLKAEFTAQHGTAGIESYDSEQLVADQLTGLLGGATLFASQRLVIIKNPTANKALADQLVGLLDTIPAETQLVLVEPTLDKRTTFYKTLKKVAEWHEYNELDEVTASKWATDLITKAGGKASSSAVRMIIEYIGTDQQRLENEVTKLLAYNPTITEAAIAELVEKNPRETIFQLLDYTLSGNTSRTLEVLQALEAAHEDPFQAANMLVWQIQVLAVVASADGVGEAEVAKVAKLNPFVVKKTRTLAQRLSKPKLNHLLDVVAEMDVTLKTTSAEPWRVLEQTIISL